MDISQLIDISWENKYLHALIILISFFIIAKIIVFISEKWILKLTAKTKTNIDDLIIKKIKNPISLIIILLGIKLALLPLDISETFSSILINIINSLLVLIAFFISMGLFDIFIDNWGKKWAEKTASKLDDQLISLLHRVSRIIVVILMFLFILDTWGVKVGPLLASLGIAGIAIAFALQSTLGNIFGGISIIIDKTVKVGDIIKLDSGEMGVVHDVGIRSTKIKTWDNEIITVPNGKLADSRVQNFSMPDPSSRINIEFGVEYGSDPEKVKKIALDVAKKVKNVLKEPEPRILFLSMGDFALQFKLMIWVDSLDKKWPTHQEVITKLYKALNKEKIGIPFPTRTVYMHQLKRRK